MCGIAGIVNAEMAAEEIGALLGRMGQSIVHRGPDESGEMVFAEERAGLAVRRLSIVDIEGGSQPVGNEDGTVYVAFNGEIYNHNELRERLRGKGHVFRSRCDTEVIVHLYEESGEDFVHELDGMFGLAVFDRRRRRLLLARDGPGMKPLYFAETGRGLLFASEIRALLATGLVEARPDRASINTYLALGYFPAPHCGLEGIEKLRAGEYLIAERGEVRRERFWQYRFQTGSPAKREEEYGEELEHLLRSAVRTHVAADVPVGALVSGGWDSSLVATFAAEHTSGPLKTFSIVFPEDPRQDESRYARMVAGRLGAEHHEIEFRASQVPDLLHRAIRHLEEPIASAPALLIYLIASLASQHVKTVLSGEGADEIFGGYPWLQRNRYHIFRRLVPASCSRTAAAWFPMYRWSWLMHIAGARDDAGADLECHRAMTPWEKDQTLRPELRVGGPDLEPVRLDPETVASCKDVVERRTAIEFTGRLAECLLFQADKMTMAHSLESRMPFLDRRVVGFAQRLPSDMKIRGKQEKYVLSLLGKHLPAEVARRRKQGLSYPVERFREEPLAGFIRETLLDGARNGGPFDPGFLKTRYERWGHQLIRRPLLMVFLQLWWNEYFGHRLRSPAAELR